jgi:hypothetical protein
MLDKKKHKRTLIKWVPKHTVTGGEDNPFKQSPAEKQAQANANQAIKRMIKGQ